MPSLCLLEREASAFGDRAVVLPGGQLTMKYVLFYQSAADVASQAPLHFAAHRARWAEFQARGTLLMIGPFGDPQAEGSMAVFTTREDAEEFATSDPFVLNGVVERWFVREWNEVLFHP